MTALRLSAEVERFHGDQQVAARFWIFLAVFLWPLTWLAVLIAVWLAFRLVGIEAPAALRYLLAVAALGGLAWLGFRHLVALRRRDADRRALFASATPAGERFPLAIALADAGGPLAAAADVLLAAPRLSARAFHCWHDRIAWDAGQTAAAQALIERLGRAGDAWTAWDPGSGDGALVDGLERLGLVEHQVEGEAISLRMPPDMRRRHFPKDPGGAFPGGPGTVAPFGPGTVAPFGPGAGKP